MNFCAVGRNKNVNIITDRIWQLSCRHVRSRFRGVFSEKIETLLLFIRETFNSVALRNNMLPKGILHWLNEVVL